MNLKEWKKINNVPSEKFLLDKIIKNIDGVNWYYDINKEVNLFFKNKKDSNLFLSLLAVTSQRNTLEVNMSMTINAFNMIKEFNNPYVLFYGIADKPIKNNIKRILNNKLPHGNKIKPYCITLRDLNLNKTVIDSWICKIFLRNKKVPNKTDIKFIRYIFKRLANKLNLKIGNIQPCLWKYARLELNDNKRKITRHEYYFKLSGAIGGI